MEVMSLSGTPFTLPALDGFPLSVHRFDPIDSTSATSSSSDAYTVRATCIIVNATGVAAQFYRSFAHHLSTKGVAVSTFDFRYSGKSFPPKYLKRLENVEPGSTEFDEIFHEALLDCPKDWRLMSHWCRKDLAAVVGFVRETWPGRPLTLLGNSLGAHLSTLLEEETLFPNTIKVGQKRQPVRILNVCGGNAYWGNQTSPEVSKQAFDTMIRDALEIDGVFRSSSLGLGYDLPYGPGTDWLKWFYHPLFSLQDPSDERLARSLGEKLQAYLYVGFEDDATITRAMQTSHLALFSHRNKNFHSLWIDPKQCEPPWPAMGHVTSFIPSSKSKSKAGKPHSAQDNSTGSVGSEAGDEEPEDKEQDDRRRPGGPATEAYELAEVNEATDTTLASAATPSLTREETIFKLYLDFILEGRIWPEAPGRAHRIWTVDDEADRVQLRRGAILEQEKYHQQTRERAKATARL